MLQGLTGLLQDLIRLLKKAVSLPRPALFPIGRVAKEMDGPTVKADLIAGLSVALLAFIREEKRFSGLDAWVAQIALDAAAARRLLAA